MSIEKYTDQYLLDIWPIKGWVVNEIKTVCKELNLTFLEVFSVLNTDTQKQKQGRKSKMIAP